MLIRIRWQFISMLDMSISNCLLIIRGTTSTVRISAGGSSAIEVGFGMHLPSMDNTSNVDYCGAS
jgi:hypothetical protein